MLPNIKRYFIWPSVVKVDEQTELTVTASERAHMFHADREYKIVIIASNANFHGAVNPNEAIKEISAVAKDGILKFNVDFDEEGEYNIFLEYAEARVAEFAIYALREDLYSLQPVKGDLHLHSYRSDGLHDPSSLMGYYREMGYDFFALTDHNRYFPGKEIEEVSSGLNTTFVRIDGEEVHAPGASAHIVHIGGNKSVSDFYVHNKEEYDRQVLEYEKKVPANVPEKYHRMYSRIMWVVDNIHAAGGIAILAHPYWRPGKMRAYHVNDELSKILLHSGLFDAYEIIGGMLQLGINRSLAMFRELELDGLRLPVVASSDVHDVITSRAFPYFYTVCYVSQNTSEGIIDAIKSNLSIAVEKVDTNIGEQNRCYGSLRLVSYTHFLISNYFPMVQRFASAEGIAMQQYSMGIVDKSFVEMLGLQVENYRKRFFGQLPPVLPTKQMLEFEEKWREVQRNGPLTKASTVYYDVPPTYQI